MFTHKFLGSPRGKHCNSLEGNVWRTFVPTSKKTILARDFRFFVALLSEMDLDNADTRRRKFWLKIHVICSKIYQLTCLHAQGLFIVNLTLRNGLDILKT